MVVALATAPPLRVSQPLSCHSRSETFKTASAMPPRTGQRPSLPLYIGRDVPGATPDNDGHASRVTAWEGRALSRPRRGDFEPCSGGERGMAEEIVEKGACGYASRVAG